MVNFWPDTHLQSCLHSFWMSLNAAQDFQVRYVIHSNSLWLFWKSNKNEMSNLKFWIPGILGDVKMLKKLKKSNSVEGKIRKLRFSLPVTLNLGFSWVKSIFQPICLMNIPNGLKRSCLARKILKIQAVEKSAKLAILEK